MVDNHTQKRVDTFGNDHKLSKQRMLEKLQHLIGAVYTYDVHLSISALTGLPSDSIIGPDVVGSKAYELYVLAGNDYRITGFEFSN